MFLYKLRLISTENKILAPFCSPFIFSLSHFVCLDINCACVMVVYKVEETNVLMLLQME